MQQFIFIITVFFLSFLAALSATKAVGQNLNQRLAGYILLQVQSHGEAWYVNPADNKRYYLGRPTDALKIMQKFSIGITNTNLAKIPLGLIDYNSQDSDQDGLPNRLEQALGTNPQMADSDNDGYNDKEEISHGYNPLGAGLLPFDYNFAKQQAGKIFLQVQSYGEAWYVNPSDNKRYYLDRPQDAFRIMRQLSLGITNQDLNQIPRQYLTPPASSLPSTANNQSTQSSPDRHSPSAVMSGAAVAIRAGNIDQVKAYFVPEMSKAIEYTLNFLGADGRLALGNILSGASPTTQTENEAIYTNEVYFSIGGYKVPVKFIIKKQPDNTWLLTNL